jgi:hypothetical protein
MFDPLRFLFLPEYDFGVPVNAVSRAGQTASIFQSGRVAAHRLVEGASTGFNIWIEKPCFLSSIRNGD